MIPILSGLHFNFFQILNLYWDALYLFILYVQYRKIWLPLASNDTNQQKLEELTKENEQQKQDFEVYWYDIV
jgi:hypothetical protein